MKNYKLTIPKPCHEGWAKMTPNEKGKFCDSCSKTVIDFTNKSDEEIKEYIVLNKGKRVCGHFKRSQLDSIVIQIPNYSFYNLSFQKLFILSLILAMGTTLFSCKTDVGKSQKIDKIEVIDSITKEVKDTLEVISKTCSKKDTILPTNHMKIPPPPIPEPEYIEGEVVEGLPAIESIEPEVPKLENIPFSIVETPPKFNKNDKGTRAEFHEKIKTFAKNNFNESFYNDLEYDKGKHRAFTMFTINIEGIVTDIKVRTKQPKLKQRLIKLISTLPKFTPAEHDGKKVEVNYALPFVFEVE